MLSSIIGNQIATNTTSKCNRMHMIHWPNLMTSIEMQVLFAFASKCAITWEKMPRGELATQ